MEVEFTLKEQEIVDSSSLITFIKSSPKDFYAFSEKYARYLLSDPKSNVLHCYKYAVEVSEAFSANTLNSNEMQHDRSKSYCKDRTVRLCTLKSKKDAIRKLAGMQATAVFTSFETVGYEGILDFILQRLRSQSRSRSRVFIRIDPNHIFQDKAYADVEELYLNIPYKGVLYAYNQYYQRYFNEDINSLIEAVIAARGGEDEYFNRKVGKDYIYTCSANFLCE